MLFRSSIKLNESLIIMEFLADLFPSANLLPDSPVLRAKARLFINLFQTRVMDGFMGFFFRGQPVSVLLDALEALQNLLPAEDGYAVGPRWCMADMAVVPMLVRIELLLKHDMGKYPEGEGRKTYETLRGGKFARYHRYLEDVKAQPSMRATWDEVSSHSFSPVHRSVCNNNVRIPSWPLIATNQVFVASSGSTARNHLLQGLESHFDLGNIISIGTSLSRTTCSNATLMYNTKYRIHMAILITTTSSRSCASCPRSSVAVAKVRRPN